WKHKTGDLALVQQESMARRIGIEIGTHNCSQIIERRRGRKVVGRRWEIQWLECAFAGLGECSSAGSGDEKGAHQQRELFCGFLKDVRLFIRRWSSGVVLGEHCRNEMSCCWNRVATCAAELIT